MGEKSCETACRCAVRVQVNDTIPSAIRARTLVLIRSSFAVSPNTPYGLWERGSDFEFPMVKNRRTGKLQDITRVLPKTTKSADVVFFKELTEGWYGLTNQKLGVGVGMAWDSTLFKYLWMWQVYGGHTDYPWYGRTYNCALEPFTSYPPAGVKNAIENGTALILAPSSTVETELVAVLYEGEGVKRIARDGVVEQ
jgi:hypothetical protein